MISTIGTIDTMGTVGTVDTFGTVGTSDAVDTSDALPVCGRGNVRHVPVNSHKPSTWPPRFTQHTRYTGAFSMIVSQIQALASTTCLPWPNQLKQAVRYLSASQPA